MMNKLLVKDEYRRDLDEEDEFGPLVDLILVLLCPRDLARPPGERFE